MNTDLPVFNLQPLNRSFYYFLITNLIIAFVSIFIIPSLIDIDKIRLLDKVNTWILFIVLFGISFLSGYRNKTALKKILETQNPDDQFRMYESFFKGRLIWNSFSFGLSGLLFILTMKNVFFYILIIQLLLSIVFYPRKAVISKELNNNEIIYT